MWTRDQKIALIGVLLTFVGIIVSIYHKEIRIALNADSKSTPVETASASPTISSHQIPPPGTPKTAPNEQIQNITTPDLESKINVNSGSDNVNIKLSRMPSTSGLVNIFKVAMSSLPNATYKGDGYNYGLDAGLRNLYDHIVSFVNYHDVVKLYNDDVYIAGPHLDGNFDLNSEYSFGHYNPEFLNWAHRAIEEVFSDPGFINRTAPIYNKYIKNKPRIFYSTYIYLKQNSVWFNELRTHYQKMINTKTLPKDYTLNLSSYENALYLQAIYRQVSDAYIADVAISFWVRRSIDGTDDEFFKLLSLVISAYDPSFK